MEIPIPKTMQYLCQYAQILLLPCDWLEVIPFSYHLIIQFQDYHPNICKQRYFYHFIQICKYKID